MSIIFMYSMSLQHQLIDSLQDPMLIYVFILSLSNINIFFLLRERMSTFQTPKKTKTATSLQTCCTFDHASEKEIKIEAVAQKNNETGQALKNSSIQLIFQEESQHSTAKNGKNLMNVPILSRKNAEFIALGGSGSSDPVTSKRLQKSNRIIDGSGDFLTQSLNFRTTNITQDSKSLISRKKLNFDYNNNVIRQPQQQNFLESQQTKKIEPQKKIQKKLWEKDSKNPELQQIYIRQYQDEKQNLTNVLFKRQPLDFKPIMHHLRLSSKYDYLYKMETSSKISRREAVSPAFYKDVPSTQLNKVRSEEKIINRREIQILQPKKTANKVNIQLEKREKYGISNKKMLQILKEDIYFQISKAGNYMKVINDAVQNSQPGQDPSDEDLLFFYNIRRRMREEVNIRLGDVLNQ